MREKSENEYVAGENDESEDEKRIGMFHDSVSGSSSDVRKR